MLGSTPDTQNLLVTLVKSSHVTEKDQGTPKWLETSIERKRSIVPISMPIDDLVSKCLSKTPKVKKARTEMRINFDKNSGRWAAEIATPLDGCSRDSVVPQDYQITRVDLGKGNHDVDMEFFEASNKKISHRVWKDEHDKKEMKETIKNMAQYINAILHPEAKPISEMSAVVDVSSLINQQSLRNLHKCKAVAKKGGEWVEDVLQNTIKHIGHLVYASKEIANIAKKSRGEQ